MSVVEKAIPRRLITGIAIAVVAIGILTAVVVFSVGGDTSSTSSPSTRPNTTVSPVHVTPSRVEPIQIDFDPGASYRIYLTRIEAPAYVRVFAFIDVAKGELRFVADNPRIYGAVVGRVADRLVLQSGDRLSVIDDQFATAPIPIGGEGFVGSWSGHAIVAEYFPERTTFHEYDRDGQEVRSVGLVGRRPDVVGGVVRNSVVVERAGRILLVGLADATVREFAVGHLLGVGGDHIVFTACTDEGECTLNNALVGDVLRTTPIDIYVDPMSGVVSGFVAPDGSGIVVHDYDRARDVVVRVGTRVVVGTGESLLDYQWSPTAQWLFRVDETTRVLEAIDTLEGTVVKVPLPPADTVSLRSAAAW